MNIRSFLRLGRTAALAGLAMLVLAASASAQGPPAGKGGPPPWAGAGGSGGGPPAWAGSGKGAGAQKAEGAAKKAAKAERLKKAAQNRAEAELNPAMTCFGLLADLGEEFYETYGTNTNNANAFGKCVSEHAREQNEDGEEPDEGESGESEESAECEEPAEGEEPAEDPIAELASLDEDPPAEDGCEAAEDETGEPEDSGDEAGDEEAAELTCFLPSAARANPFAVCVRA